MDRTLLFSLLVACAACGGRVVVDGQPQSSAAGGAGGTGTTSGAGATSSGSSGSSASSASSSSGAGAAPCSPPSSPPLPALWYPLDGDVLNAGSLGAAYDGVPVDVAWLPGKMGQAAQVGNGWIDLPDSADVLQGENALTIALWLKPDLVDGGEPYLDCRADEYGFHSYHGIGPSHLITTCSNGGCGSFELPNAGWHHILYRYTNTPGVMSPLDIYVDGNHAVTAATDWPIFSGYPTDIALGRHNAGGGWVPSQHLVDDLRVYVQVFSEEEQCTQIAGGSWCGGKCQFP